MPTLTDPKGAAQIAAEIRRLCLERRTGRYTLFTIHNTFAYMDLLEGRIIWIAYGNKSGVEALTRWQQDGEGEGTFIASMPARQQDRDLPDNDAILGQLTPAEGDDVAPKAPVSAPPSAFSAAQSTQVIALLARRVGPMAQFLFDDAVAQTASAEEAIIAMAQHIPAPQEANAFIAEANKLLSTAR